MATRNVVLTPHQHELVESLVATGRYQNASEVLRAGLRLLERQEEEDAARIGALRAAADVGWTDLDQGRYRDVEPAELESFINSLGTRSPEDATQDR